MLGWKAALVPGIIHHSHLGSDIVIRHTCVHLHSLCSTHTAYVHVCPFSYIACAYVDLHTHGHTHTLACIYCRCSFICNILLPHSLVTALQSPPPLFPPSLHLPVWEKPVGFVLSWVWRHADLCCNRPWRWASSILGLANHSWNLAVHINSNPRKENQKILWHQKRMEWWDLKLELWGCRGYF